jgi:hypothetical protein
MDPGTGSTQAVLDPVAGRTGEVVMRRWTVWLWMLPLGLIGCTDTTGSGGMVGDGGSGGGGITGASIIPYDRATPEDLLALVPFPDDYWLVADASTPTGHRVDLSVPSRDADVIFLFLALMAETKTLDGFSPVGGIVIALSDEPDTDSLPLTPEASLEPSATVQLFDLTPGGDAFGHRIPFALSPISRQLVGQEIDHSMVIYPSISLTPKGRYAVVVTRDARAKDGRPFAPSHFLTAVLGPEEAGEGPEITRARALIEVGVVDVLADERLVSPPILPEDLALVLRFTVRSTDDIPLTPLSMKEQILTGPPPSYSISSVDPGSGYVAAVVRGTWDAPNWREDQYFISRDENGDPQITRSVPVPFVLAVPQAAESGPVPVVMFQHGSPGSAEQAYWEARAGLAEAGFAVIGFTDTMNRELGQDLDFHNAFLFETLITNQRFPHFPMQLYGEQMAFLRVIEQLGSVDVVPAPGGDGVPDLDLEAPLTYVGLSMGCVHGSAFLTYAPEIKAAAIAAGAQRQGEAYFNSGTFIDKFPPHLLALMPNVRPVDFWVGLSIFQMIFDHQDAHQHAVHLYRDPLEVAGTVHKASVLLQEGLADSLMPANAMHSLAWTFGPLPQLDPIWDPSPILEPITGPVTGNIDSETTAALYQFVPVGIPGIEPTPGCEALAETDGHGCVQGAAEAQRQRALFLRSAVENLVPTIVDPLSAGE